MPNGTRRQQSPPRDVQWGLRPIDENRLLCEVPAAPFDVLPREQIEDVSLRKYVNRIFSQVDGMCTSNASAQLAEMLRKKSGQPHEDLSAVDLYRRVGRWGTGSTLRDNLVELSRNGIAPESVVQRNQWPVNVPDDWEHRAADYKLLEWFDLLGNIEMVLTAITYDYPTIIGFRWPGGGYHAVVVDTVKKHRRNNSFSFTLGGPNSWSENWNDGGFWELHEDHITPTLPRLGAWCGRVMTHPE